MAISGFFNFSASYGEADIPHGPVTRSQPPASTARYDFYHNSGSPTKLLKHKPFLLYKNQPDVAYVIAKDLRSRYLQTAPDVITSFVSGHEHFHEWKRDDLRSALQAGIVKLLDSLNLLVIDDGLNYGLTHLVGAAIRTEDEHRSRIPPYLQTEVKKDSINYIAIVPLVKLLKPERFSSLHERNENKVFQITSESLPGLDNGFDLSRHHSHYILIDDTLSYSDISSIRIDVEKHLQDQLGELLIRRADDATGKGTKVPFIPHVAFFFQGGLEELDRIQSYLDRYTPIVIMDGCGGMADVLAACLKFDLDQKKLFASIQALLVGAFPELKSTEVLQKSYTEKLEQIVNKSRPQRKLCYTVDCRQLATFNNLDVPLLEAIIEITAKQHANSNQHVRNFLLCIKCNRPDVVVRSLINKQPWLGIRNKWTLSEFTYPALRTSLILPGREAFVEILLEQRFPLRFFTSHLDLLDIFQKAPDKEIFTSVVWENMLENRHSESIDEKFVLKTLNALIYQMTGIRHYLDIYEMSRVALTRNDHGIDTRLADDMSLRALTVYAVLLNRGKLVKVLLKPSRDPVASVLFVETMYRGMYRATGCEELRNRLKNQAVMFGQMAEGIVNAGISEAPHRARLFFHRKIPAFNDKTMLEMAFDARNRSFISNPHVRNWLSQFSRNFIRVKGSWPDTKLVLAALLVFPMYMWLVFPINRQSLKTPSGTIDEEFDEPSEPPISEDPTSFLKNLKQSAQRGQPIYNRLQLKENFPPLLRMMFLVWDAPVVKFWIWFATYLAFLVLIAVAMMSPACTNFGLDIAVFVVSVLMLLELITRTISDVLYPTKADFADRFFDLAIQITFNTLFFLYRLVPYRYDHPFAGRVILAFGVLYYFYCVWHKFFIFTHWLGPNVRIITIMYKLDLSRWLVILFPFFASTAVIWQSLITPDYPFSLESWRRALHQAISTVFGAYVPQLDDSRCEQSHLVNWRNFSQPTTATPADRCWLGDYNDYTCPTVSVWSYFFEIQYYFFLKFGLMIVIVVVYTGRVNREMGKAIQIWRYKRFEALQEYYWRSSLPFPLNIVGNLLRIVTYIWKRDSEAKPIDPELVNMKVDSSYFWESTATAYFARKEKEESVGAFAGKYSTILNEVRTSIQSTIGHLDIAEKKKSQIVGEDSRLFSDASTLTDESSPLTVSNGMQQAKIRELEMKLRTKEEENLLLLRQLEQLKFKTFGAK